jgi:CobQ-like glutamine amidotransferase family enzyme
MTTLHIAHLYPKELGINGDVGNVMALSVRSRAYGLDVRVSDIHRGDTLPSDIDLVHIGSGPTDSLLLVLPDIRRHASQLSALRDDGVPFVAISAGWFALSESVTLSDGTQQHGAGVFPTVVRIIDSRAVGEVELATDFGVVTGFENHSSFVMDGGLPHFGRMIHGIGSDASRPQSERWDGVVMGSSIGTNVHGPLLPMNPGIADALISAAMVRKIPNWETPESEKVALLDDFAFRSRQAVIDRL